MGIRALDMTRLASCLRAGNCSRLRKLHLSAIRTLLNLNTLMEALVIAPCNASLEELNFTGSIMSRGDMLAIASSLQNGGCRHLTTFHLGYTLWDDINAEALARMLSSLTHLETLSLGGRSILQEGMSVVGEALRQGAVPHLKKLDLGDLEL